MQKYKTTIRLDHTDAAGVVFYANLFVLAHDCFEDWLGQHISLSELLGGNLQTPVVHTEADYKLPMCLSDSITIEMTIAKKQQTSFALQYTFMNSEGQQTASVQTVHVAIDSQTRRPVDVPPFLQDALAAL